MPNKLMPTILISIVLMDVVLTIHAFFDLKRIVAMPDPGGFMGLFALLIFPFYIFFSIILLIITLQTIFTLLKYKNQNSEESVLKIQEKIFTLFIQASIYLAVMFYFFLESFGDLFFGLLNENLYVHRYLYNVIFQILVLVTICGLLIYGFYKAINKFFKYKLFWFIFAILLFFITYIVIPVFLMPPAGRITHPDGTTEIIYYLPNGSTSTEPF